MRARPGGGSALRQWPLCPACWSRTPRSAPALPRCFNSPQSRMHLCVSIPYTWTVPLRPVACQNFGVFKHMQAAEHPWLQQAGQSAQTRSRGPSVDRSVLQRLQVLRCFCELLTSNGHAAGLHALQSRLSGGFALRSASPRRTTSGAASWST